MQLVNNQVYDKKGQKRGLGIFKIKEFTFVDGCFQSECNEVFGVFL